ncbi:HupE/UreJ family protein [Acidovorax sp.]|uniref:HupE/UreJ family protein n=1 Tax=Acidovorax sp. TaxID=1872122 RepID=UPI000AF4ADCF|nr:HupE/UreJ family protein [Acidovorax sp.]
MTRRRIPARISMPTLALPLSLQALAGHRKPRFSLPGWMAVLAACLLWWCAASPALAHSSSNSFLALSARDGALVLRADVHLRDLDLQFDLDRDRNGEVTWAEVTERQGELQAWLTAGITLTAGGTACALAPVDVLASQRSDGTYLSAEWTLPDCARALDAGQGPLALRYSLIFAQDSLHRALLRVDTPALQTSAMLSPEQPEAKLQAGGGSALQVLQRYVVDGVWHIWIGIDHILFLLSLLVLAPLVPSRQRVTRWAPEASFRAVFLQVLAVVTAFTVAHSITLIASVMGWLNPPANLIEPVIALSVVLAALNNLLGFWAFTRWRLAFAFGLIHGFGFANVLLDLGLPARDLAMALGGFNVGVELGQLAIVLVFLPVAWALRRMAFYRVVVVAGGSLAIAVIGTWWIVDRMGLL